MVEPLFSRVPDLADERAGVRVWLFDDAAMMVDQVTVPEVSLTIAKFLAETVEAELQRRWVSAGRKVTYVHDLRRCTGYETQARAALIAWGRATVSHVKLARLVLSNEVSIFARIAASTAVTALKALGNNIEISDRLDDLLAQVDPKRA